MAIEVIEAICNYYKDDTSLLVDCLLFLSKLQGDAQTKKLNQYAKLCLESMGRCPYCGEKMQAKLIREPHTELGGCPYEELYQQFCPKCGRTN